MDKNNGFKIHNKTDPPHQGQIIVTRESILHDMIWGFCEDIPKNTDACLKYGPDHPDYEKHLLAAALQLAFLDRFVYRGKDSWKPSADWYKRYLFEYPDYEADRHKKDVLAEIICHMLANFTETRFACEFAYAIDYVARHKDLPKPVYDDGSWVKPDNYPDFCPEEFYEKYMNYITR